MATIRKRGDKWYAEVRRKGAPSQSKTFSKKGDASAWARQIENDIDRGKVPQSRSGVTLTLAEALDRYVRTRTAMKSHPEREERRALQLARSPLGEMTLSAISPKTISAYRNLRLNPPRETKLKPVSAGTVRLELSLLSDLFTTAINEWDLPLEYNPVALVKKPKPAPARDRRLREEPLIEEEAVDSGANRGTKAFDTAAQERIKNRPQWAPWVTRATGEEQLLLQGAWGSGNPDLLPAILLALDTTMRQSQLLNLEWNQVDMANRRFTLVGKDGKAVQTPIRRDALSILKILRKASGTRDRVFESTVQALRHAFHRLKKRIRITNLRWHDLRHEGCSRLGDLGATAPQLAAVSQHKTLAMVSRYTHLGLQATTSAIDRLEDDRDGGRQ